MVQVALADVVDAVVVEVVAALAEEDDNDNVNPNLNLETWNKISLPKQGGMGWVSGVIYSIPHTIRRSGGGLRGVGCWDGNRNPVLREWCRHR